MYSTKAKFGVCYSIFLLLLFGAHAQDNLMVFPKRLVFQGGKDRVRNINIVNNGTGVSSYKISFIELKMTPAGELVPIDGDHGETWMATPYFRVYPRSVTLNPGESQVVKVQLLNARTLSEGEYRSHLYFRNTSVPKADMGEASEKNTGDHISVKLNYVFGISIPTIIRTGRPNIKVDIKNVKMERAQGQPPVLSMDIERFGNISSYGNVVLEHIAPSGKVSVIHVQKGLAVYTPLHSRHVTFPLDEPGRANLGKGQLKVTYEAAGNKVVYASAVLDL
ncbi:MAG: molecular chaperone [Flavobacteriaceae bacterium]